MTKRNMYKLLVIFSLFAMIIMYLYSKNQYLKGYENGYNVGFMRGEVKCKLDSLSKQQYYRNKFDGKMYPVKIINK